MGVHMDASAGQPGSASLAGNWCCHNRVFHDKGKKSGMGAHATVLGEDQSGVVFRLIKCWQVYIGACKVVQRKNPEMLSGDCTPVDCPRASQIKDKRSPDQIQKWIRPVHRP